MKGSSGQQGTSQEQIGNQLLSETVSICLSTPVVYLSSRKPPPDRVNEISYTGL